ncbi:hypothetical protein [Nonomuraea sp. SYSU D8015]|uniref:hypothetical protein n=1 Tax=Nonomuraea sp. SYSU D8015 TaxID=2593644 RepID=UPI0016603F6E|nr:hypothetical protein [Nonomuraea sp. SYSU D8015]
MGKHRKTSMPNPTSNVANEHGAMLARFGTTAPEAETLLRFGSLVLSNIATGFAPDRATAAALRSFSDPENVVELGASVWERIETE